VLAVSLALVASLLATLPAQAAGPGEQTDTARRSSLTTLSPAALARLQLSPQQSQPQTGDTNQSGSFFKSKKGAAALALIGAGFGYALYSKVHDRVLSPVRQ
jgi:hypothetical protein